MTRLLDQSVVVILAVAVALLIRLALLVALAARVGVLGDYAECEARRVTDPGLSCVSN